MFSNVYKNELLLLLKSRKVNYDSTKKVFIHTYVIYNIFLVLQNVFKPQTNIIKLTNNNITKEQSAVFQRQYQCYSRRRSVSAAPLGVRSTGCHKPTFLLHFSLSIFYKNNSFIPIEKLTQHISHYYYSRHSLLQLCVL